MLSLQVYLKSVRPVGWIPSLFSLTMGLVDGGFHSLPKALLALFAFGPLLLGGSYTLNFLSDAELDRRSIAKKDLTMSSQPFASGQMTTIGGYIMASLLIVSGISISFMLSFWFVLFAAYSAVIGLLYSFVIRLKSKPYADVFANSTTLGSAAYSAGWATFQPIGSISVYSLLWITLMVGATYILTVILDIEGDRAGGLATTATAMGLKNSLRLSFLMYTVSFLFFLMALVTHWFTLAYWIVFPPLLKGIHSYLRLYREPSRIFHVAKRAVISAIVSVAALLPLYSFLSVIGLKDFDIIESILTTIRWHLK